METFSALLALCAENSPVPGEFPSQRPVTWSSDVSFDLRLNKHSSKQWRGWWFETPSCSLWRHRNDLSLTGDIYLLLSNIFHRTMDIFGLETGLSYCLTFYHKVLCLIRVCVRDKIIRYVCSHSTSSATGIRWFRDRDSVLSLLYMLSWWRHQMKTFSA